MIVALLYFLLCMAGFVLFADLQLDHCGEPAPKGRYNDGTGKTDITGTTDITGKTDITGATGITGITGITGRSGDKNDPGEAGKVSVRSLAANRVSVIIPVRNEEKNLPCLLGSLLEQTVPPCEIIVVDDFSSDRTREIAEKYAEEFAKKYAGNNPVKVIPNLPLPEGWTGKNWAVWNGYLHSTGDILAFLDADVRLAPDALKSLLVTRERCGGAISVVPFHRAEKFYERLTMVLNILAMIVFTSPFERRSDTKGLYGSCIIASRVDYTKIGGHRGVRSELLDDLNLGKRFREAGIPVNNFIGTDLVSFRMYPDGLKSEIEGFVKSAAAGASTMRPATIFFVAAWVIGLLTNGVLTPIFLALRHPLAFWFLLGYVFYTIQIFYFIKFTGRFGVLVPVFHFLSSLFMAYIMLCSLYRITIAGSVSWKGRQINIGGRKGL